MAARGEPCFGDFRLDLANQILWRGGSEVRLTPRAFVLLRHLVEHHDRLVTKDELLNAVWGGLHVGDSVVKVRIGELRHALTDPVAEPRYIATVHRRGYRFVATVTEAGGLGTFGPATPAIGRSPSGFSDAPALSSPRPAARAVPPLRAQYLVGREPVLARLDDRLARALDGSGQVIFLAGDAGMGKTSLIEAFLERAGRVAGIWLAIGRCVEHYGVGEPYLPLLEALGRLCQDTRGHLLIEVLRRHAPMWLLQLPWLLEPHERVALQREVTGGTKERMLRELTSALAAFTVEHPLILALEDLHWSDASTLDLVGSLAQSRHPTRLLIVLTYRASDAMARGHPVRTLRNDLSLHGACDEENLELLSEQDIADYLAARLSSAGLRRQPASDALPGALATLVHRRTDGNPLFMASLIDEVIRRGTLEASDDGLGQCGDPAQLEIGVPVSVREMIERDYDRLDRSDRDLLEAASVAGVEFSARIVAAALDWNPVDFERRCEELAHSRQFLQAREVRQWPDGVVDASYAFRHALYQEVLYAETPSARRMRLHRRLGECLEETLGARANERAAELALHFERGGDPVRAVGHLRHAAENAVRRCANREAIETLTRAAALLAALPGEVRDTIELDLREQIGLVRRSMGDMHGAARDFDALVELAQRLDRRDREAKALLYLCSALTWIDRERRSAVLTEAVRVAERVEDDLLRAHALGYAAYWNLSLRGWREDDERACTAAVEAARRAGDRELLGLHVGRYAYFHCMHARYEIACRTAEEGLEIALAVGNAFEAMACQHYHASALLEWGRWGEMLETLGEAIDTAERNGHTLWASFFRLQIGLLCLQTSAFERARELAERGLADAQAAGHADGEVFSLSVLAQALLGLGDHAEGLSALARLEDRAGPNGALGGWVSHMSFRQALADYWLGRGDLERAQDEAESVRRLAEPPGQTTYLALARMTLAVIAAERGNRGEAETELAGALDLVSRADVPLAAWRVHALAARFAEQRRDRREQAEHRSRSADIVAALSDSLAERAPDLRTSFLARVRTFPERRLAARSIL